MLFDIRGRRKHVVRVVYAILALLMGASLFLVVGPFNIGNLINGGSSANSAAKVLDEQAERIEQKLARNPNDEALLLSLTRTRIAAANALTEVNPETGATVATVEGKEELERATEAWNRYLKQSNEPSPSAALLVARAYFTLAETATLEDATINVRKAAETQRIAAEAHPTINSLTNLAIDEYFAGNFAAGDQAAKQAEAKAGTAAAKKEVRTSMAEYRKRGKEIDKERQEIAKAEKGQSKERLESPFSGLGTGATGE